MNDNPLGPVVAVRTVEETDEYRTIEGRAIPFGGPFNGKDFYGTFFSVRTDLALETPIKVWYNHGFDPDFGFSSIGHVVSYRTEDDGIWTRVQLDKRHKFYEGRVKPLLDDPAGPQLGFSAGSAEHSYREDPKSGELLSYPVHEISLTPTEANPWAMIAARSAENIHIVEAVRKDMDPNVGGGMDRDKLDDSDFAGPNRSFPIVKPGDVSDAASSLGRAKGDTDTIKANIIKIAKRKGASFVAQLPKAWSDDGSRSAVRSASLDAAQAYSIVQQILYLRDMEAGEADQVAKLNAAVSAMQEFATMELAEPEPNAEPAYIPVEAVIIPDLDRGFESQVGAVRAGARNNATDQAHLNQAHQAAHDAMTHTLAAGAGCDACNDGGSDADGDDDAARSAEPLIVITGRVPEAPRIDIDAIAVRAAKEAVAKLTG